MYIILLMFSIMTTANFEIDNVICPKNTWEDVIASNGIKSPFNKDLVPVGINYVISAENDYLKYVAIWVANNIPVLLEWPKWTWKTTAISYIAQETNNPLVYMQLTWATGLDSFVWKWLINEKWTYWVNWVLAEAMLKGYWLVLDELNMALPEIAAVLHSVMDDRRILVLEGKW